MPLQLEGNRRFTANTNNVITFTLVHNLRDINQRAQYRFRPKMSHQVFEDETVFGYRNPKINIYYLANSGHCLIEFLYDEAIRAHHDTNADDVLELLRPWFPNNFITDMAEYRDLVSHQNHTRFYGRTVNRFSNANRVGDLMRYKVTACDKQQYGFSQFHSRFQSLIIFFIDAANFIDLQDAHWLIYYLYEERPLGLGRTGNYPIGFCTVYKYFAYPDKVRARISQFFILPPFQRMGLGYKLLRSVNESLPQVITNLKDITVESPNKVFVQMRDNIDALRLMRLPEFAPQNLQQGYKQYMYDAAVNNFKMSKKQIRHIYEIIRYHVTPPHTEEYECMKNYIKKNRRLKYERKYKRVRHGHNLVQIAYYENILNTPIENCEVLEQEFQRFKHGIRFTLQYLNFH